MGHLEHERVIEPTKNHLHWSNYEKDIKEYVTEKRKCLKDKKPNLAQRARLETITITQPFELITIDYLYLDQYKGKYTYLLLAVDHFTKLAQKFSTRKQIGEIGCRYVN